jgi:hypothetical protein
MFPYSKNDTHLFQWSPQMRFLWRVQGIDHNTRRVPIFHHICWWSLTISYCLSHQKEERCSWDIQGLPSSGWMSVRQEVKGPMYQWWWWVLLKRIHPIPQGDWHCPWKDQSPYSPRKWCCQEGQLTPHHDGDCNAGEHKIPHWMYSLALCPQACHTD